jgi:hypothetical protein
MNLDPQNLAARYANAIQFEKNAWLAMQAESPGTRDRAAAWAVWSEATYRTNLAWSQLSSHTLSKAGQGKQAFPDVQPAGEPAATPPHYTR